MPLNKPSFNVVVGTVTFLAIAGVLLRSVADRLPRDEEEVDAARGALAQRILGTKIRWQPLTEETFAEARRLERPVMLMVGAVWSRDAREAGRRLFVDEDVYSYINRNFLPAYVDVDQNPAWVSALLPLSRVNLDTGPGFQIAYFTPQAELYEVAGRLTPISFDPRFFTSQVGQAREAFDQLPSPLPPELNFQMADQITLREPPARGFPDQAVMRARLLAAIGPTGGFSQRGGQSMRVAAWRYLLAVGETEALRASLDPPLRSGVVDWLDGGFFRRARDKNWQSVDFDKLTILNAEMMRLLADAGAVLKNDYYTELAKRTFDALRTDLFESNFAVTARVGDEDARGRSPRASFAFREVGPLWGGTLLDQTEATWARDQLGLNPDQNRAMSIRVSDPAVMKDPRFEQTLNKLRNGRKNVRPYRTTRPIAAVQGRVAAQMMHCARLWEDTDRVTQATQMFERAEAFREGSGILTFLDSNLDDSPRLADFVAYADAALADYLTNGRFVSFQSGAEVLDRALDLFGTAIPGYFPERPPGTASAALNSPEVLDVLGDSSTSMLLRLCWSYGRLCLTGPGAAKGRRFSQVASAIANHYGEISTSFRVLGAGFHRSSLEIEDNAHAVTVGPQALLSANSLSALRPNRLVAPAFGDVRPDLQSRAPGVYVVREGVVSGPFSVSRAAEELGEFLKPLSTSP